MNKLKLNELAPYLPYKLKAYFKQKNTKTCRKMVIGTIGGIYSNCSIVCHDTVNATPDKFFPILRTISEADSIMKNEFLKYNTGEKYDNILVELFCYEHTGTSELLSEIDLLKLPFDSVSWLIQNHFDVFGLIEKKLAINANALFS